MGRPQYNGSQSLYSSTELLVLTHIQEMFVQLIPSKWIPVIFFYIVITIFSFIQHFYAGFSSRQSEGLINILNAIESGSNSHAVLQKFDSCCL